MPFLDEYERLEVRRKAVRKALGQADLSSLLSKGQEEQEEGRRRVQGLLAAPEEEDRSFGRAAKSALGVGVSALDYLGSIARHGIREVAETTGLRENTVGLTAGEVLRGTEEADNTVKNMRATLGIDPNAGGRWAGALDTLGMALTDPLTYLTLGSGAAAKTALGTVARTVGDDVAGAITRGGVRAGDEVLEGRAASVVNDRTIPIRDQLIRAGQDAAPEQVSRVSGAVTPRSVRELLAEAADTGLSRRNLDDVVDRQLRTLDRRGRGGVGIAGFQTGFLSKTGERAAGGAREALLPLTRLLSPTADVTAQLGRPAAEAVDVAIHTGGNVRREQRDLLADTISDTTERSVEVQRQAKIAMANDLAELGGDRLVRTEPSAGWVELDEGRFVPKVVKDALDQSVRKPPGQLLEAVDKGISILKRYTTLGPLNAVPHVSRNIVSNKLFAATFGGVTDPRYLVEARNLRKSLQAASPEARKNGGLMLEKELRDQGLDQMAIRRALATHDQQLAGRGGSAFDDVDVDGANVKGGKQGREGLLGTRTAARVNQYDEELTRGAVFLKGLDEGLDPRLAARKSRHALLDYTDEGLTNFERNVMQRVMFFYKFPRRSIPAGVEFMARYPGLADALGDAGLGVAQGARNDYNEKIGTYLDSPLEATVGGIGDLIREPFGAVNPVLKAAVTGLSGEEVVLGDALPPLGQLQDDMEDVTTGNPLRAVFGEAGPKALLGFREGKDFAKDRWVEERDARVIEKGEPSKTDRLIAAAEKVGVKDPYDMKDSQLVKALKAKGMPVMSISALLKEKKD